MSKKLYSTLGMLSLIAMIAEAEPPFVIDDRNNYQKPPKRKPCEEELKTLSTQHQKAAKNANGHAVMRTFVINGKAIEATNKKMAQKKYNALYK